MNEYRTYFEKHGVPIDFETPKNNGSRADDWKSHLILTNAGAPRPILANAVTGLWFAPEWNGVLA